MTTTKTCNKCKKDKELTEFNKHKGCKDGIRSRCKACCSAYNKKWQGENREARLAYKKQYDIDNRDKIQAYYQANRESILSKVSEWANVNKDKRRASAERYRTKMMATDLSYKITKNLRYRMWEALNGISKHAPTIELLGCTVEHFRFHLEQQFTDGMTWDNYGDWHMDHIHPCSSFDQTDPEQQKICWHYTNYQPLWASDNCSKRDTIIGEHQVKLL